MYQAVCDGCGKTCPDYDGIIAWETRRSARQVALDSGWFAVNHCLYCPDCVEYDKETDSYKPKKRKTMNSIWIARDKDGSLYAFPVKPVRDDLSDAWVTDDDSRCCRILDDWFPDLKWDDEPLELVSKGKEATDD